ncbi:MAG: hypothetical protein HY814_06325 [Candidatus Riflebacteria bacterium]|nr:hypothetical protein [Candidatus Riflebacteria bacterium]
MPIVGELFRRKRTEVLTREIVMTVTPRIVDDRGTASSGSGRVTTSPGTGRAVGGSR